MRGKETIEVVCGRGNAFRNLGRIHADADQFKALLATEIIKNPGPGTPHGARCTGADRHRGGRFFSYSPCRSWTLHG